MAERETKHIEHDYRVARTNAPLREVIDRRAHGASVTETLACGHAYRVIANRGAAKRRRCPECAIVAQAQA